MKSSLFPDFDPLPWSARVQIALDSARGLQYIHEHTVPVYIHRDIKSENILIDRKLCAKVQSGSTTLGSYSTFLLGIFVRDPILLFFAGCRFWFNQVD